jgi:hypothetical protein
MKIKLSKVNWHREHLRARRGRAGVCTMAGSSSKLEITISWNSLVTYRLSLGLSYSALTLDLRNTVCVFFF